ncbi:MAG: hypothetical protein F4X92_00660 [Gammaproteobacteria bacterium]|nr:hypothetical protein [Gammaproteobacteria bacterium]
MNDMEHFISEGKERARQKMTVRHHPKKICGRLKNHDYSDAVIGDIKRIIQLFKQRKDSVLRSKHHAHELNEPLNGFSSLHLYPENTGDRDIVILYKVHRNDHVVLHKIGNHQYV